MKSYLRISLGTVAALLFCALWGGCASAPMVDWNGRIGNFTYAQAVQELGASTPQKQADGTTVAEWLTQRDERRTTAGVGTGISSAGVGAGIAQPLTEQPHDQYLQLTFDKDGKLSAWKRLVH